MNRRIIAIILPALLFLLALGIRLWHLDVIPNGLQQDETSIGYNAFSIATIGKDEYGKFYPLFFKAFGEYKMPVPIYIASAAIGLLGPTPFALRLPFAALGALTIPVLFFLATKLQRHTDDLLFPLSASLGLALNPWHIHFSRGAFEVTMALFFIACATLSFIHALETRRHAWLSLSVAFFVLSLYTYTVMRVLVPALFILLVILYRSSLHVFTKRSWMTIFLVGFFLCIPLVVSVFSPAGYGAAKGTLITSSPTVRAQLLEVRSYMIDLPPVVAKVFFNMWLLTFWKYVEHILRYIDASFFFLTGPSHGNHGIGNVGLFYRVELLFMITGIMSMIVKKERMLRLTVAWAIMTILVAAATRESPHATRSFFLILPLVIFSGYGASQILRAMFQKPQSLTLSLTRLGIFAVLLFELVYYFSSYFIRFPILYAKQWRSAERELAYRLKREESAYSTILIDPRAGVMYTSLLYYQGYPPDKFLQTVERAPDDNEGFSKVTRFGNYVFRSIDWTNDLTLPKTLIVTSPEYKPEGIQSLVTLSYPRRPVVLSANGMIAQYPVEEPAFALVSSENH